LLLVVLVCAISGVIKAIKKSVFMYLIILLWTYLDLVEFLNHSLNHRGHWDLVAKFHLDGNRLYTLFLQGLHIDLHGTRLLPASFCLNRNRCDR
jgi:hypothetical protein